ncbi:MAG: DNA polymerase III subunit beta [Candidatus Kapabacteria bacterium]|nr:DNA polymerase III subunit beta [Candidatus Kapabacteria bacterium]
MIFTVSISEFSKLLQKTLPVIPPKSTLPVLEHLHFSVKNGKLQVIATDQEVTIMSVIFVATESEGEILVPGRRLNEIIRALGNEGEIKFEANLDNYEIILKTPSGRYVIKGIDPQEYLDIPELFEEDNKYEFTTFSDNSNPNKAFFAKADLMRIANKTTFAVSTDEYRPAMTGVLFQFRGNRIHSVATDSYRLVKYTINSAQLNFPEQLDVIIPARTVDLLKKLDNDVFMAFLERRGKITHVRFEIGGETLIVSRIINEKFPPYESVLPKDNPIRATVDYGAVLSAIKRAAIMANEKSKQVQFIFDDNQLTITGEDEDSGTSAKEQLACEFPYPRFEIGFNYKYIEDAFSHIEIQGIRDNQAILTFSEPTKPALLIPNGDSDDLVMLIMPVRI